MKAPQIVVVSIVVRKNKFLLVKRAREPFTGRWSFVGGLSIMNEHHSSDPLQASKDEVKADLNCNYSKPKFYSYSFREKDTPTVSLYFYGDIKGKPKVNPKYVSEARWFSIEEVKKLNLAFEHKKFFEKFVKEVLKH